MATKSPRPSGSEDSLAPVGRRSGLPWLKVAQWLFAVLVIVFVLRGLRSQWSKAEEGLLSLQIHWGPILLASAIVLAVYALLIHAWRYMLAAWDRRLRYPVAARIWFASSLGKYVPGYIWSLTAMGVMSRELGISPVAAAGSSLVIQVLNIASGTAVALVCGARLIPNPVIAGLLLIVIVATAASAPYALPTLGRFAARVTGRSIMVPQLSPWTVWFLLAWTAIAWIGYGLAYQLFASGLLHHAGSHDSVVVSPLLFIAVYTAAYIAGLIAPTPAGLGMREAWLIAGFQQLHLMSVSDAIIVAFASRLWLTVLEVVPGVIALVLHQTTHRPRSA